MCFRMQVPASEQRFSNHLCTVATILLVANAMSLGMTLEGALNYRRLYALNQANTRTIHGRMHISFN